MPTYGGQNGGTQATYGGASYSATDTELLHQIAKRLGINGETPDPDLGWWAFLAQMAKLILLPKAPASTGDPNKDKMVRAVLQTMMPDLKGYKWVDLVYQVLDWQKSEHQEVRGPVPYETPTEGGATVHDRLGTLYHGFTTGEGIVTPDFTYDQLNAIALQVWNEYSVSTWSHDGYTGSFTMANALRIVASVAQLITGGVGIPLPQVPHFRIITREAGETGLAIGDMLTAGMGTLPAPIDPLAVELGDTVWSYLTREQPGFGWTRIAPWVTIPGTQGWVWGQDPGVSDWYYVCTMTDAEMAAMLPANVEQAGWPGEANADLLDPIEVTESGAWPIPCAGVIVDITAVGPGQGRQLAGEIVRYPYIAYLTFLADNGSTDVLQRIEFDKTVYIPQSIQHPAGFAVYAKPGFNATLTPWVFKAAE